MSIPLPTPRCCGRSGSHPCRPLGDGPGHADGPCTVRRRGTRMRLEQGHNPISGARPEPSPATGSGATSSRPEAKAFASQEFVRKGGAAARMMLLEAAAKEWSVPVAELAVDKGLIAHAKSNRSVTYGKIAAA